MNTKNTLISIFILVVFVAGLVYLGKAKTENAPTTTNSDMFVNEKDTPILIEENVDYFKYDQLPDEEADGYFVRPEAAGSYPGVVMIHENRGLRPEIKQAAQSLAKEGYMVFAVDLLGGTAEDQEGAKALTANFNQEKGVANMRAAVQYLRERGATKIASWGWCFGGRQSVELAISGEPLDATVVYYGGNMATTADRLAPIKWPVLGVFGAEDQAVPLEKVNEFEASLDTLGITHEIYIYPGVGHAFANPSGMNYAPEETRDAWGKTLSFLEDHLK